MGNKAVSYQIKGMVIYSLRVKTKSRVKILKYYQKLVKLTGNP